MDPRAAYDERPLMFIPQNTAHQRRTTFDVTANVLRPKGGHERRGERGMGLFNPERGVICTKDILYTAKE